MRRTLSAFSIALSLVFALAAFGEQLGTSWTYQGQLQRSGAAYNGTCNFQFSLWDAASAGTQQGSTQSINGVNVVNGLFTVVLDFGEATGVGDYFGGDARWLGTSVQCSGDGGFTPLDPRQPITAAPYALSLRPGATITGRPGVTSPTIGTLNVHNPEGGIGLKGSTTNNGTGVYGTSEGGGPDSNAVLGVNFDGTAISGVSIGSGPAISGRNTSTGLAGRFVGPVDITGPLSVDQSFRETGTAIEGFGGNTGVFGRGNYTGVFGQGTFGVRGVTFDPGGAGVFGGVGIGADSTSAGVHGFNSAGPAIFGQSTGAGPAVYGQATGGGLAGRFTGPVVIEGNLIVQGGVSKGGGNFRIDHPLDPANKFLSHSFVESPDMMNIYNGNVTTDATGSVTVTLPDYFAALNRDCRYQLTVLGQFAQAIVSRKIDGNSFEIRTDKPGVEVSWQVTGIRQDAYAQANPIVVEESKPAEEQGLYLFPAGFGAGEEKAIGYPSRPATPQN